MALDPMVVSKNYYSSNQLLVAATLLNRESFQDLGCKFYTEYLLLFLSYDSDLSRDEKCLLISKLFLYFCRLRSIHSAIQELNCIRLRLFHILLNICYFSRLVHIFLDTISCDASLIRQLNVKFLLHGLDKIYNKDILC